MKHAKEIIIIIINHNSRGKYKNNPPQKNKDNLKCSYWVTYGSPTRSVDCIFGQKLINIDMMSRISWLLLIASFQRNYAIKWVQIQEWDEKLHSTSRGGYLACSIVNACPRCLHSSMAFRQRNQSPWCFKPSTDWHWTQCHNLC